MCPTEKEHAQILSLHCHTSVVRICIFLLSFLYWHSSWKILPVFARLEHLSHILSHDTNCLSLRLALSLEPSALTDDCDGSVVTGHYCRYPVISDYISRLWVHHHVPPRDGGPSVAPVSRTLGWDLQG